MCLSTTLAAALTMGLSQAVAPSPPSPPTSQASPAAQSPAASPPGPFEESTFQSTVMMESRRVVVRLPPRYASEPDRRYPVVYKFDGTNGLADYHQTIGVLTSLDLMPDVIVVALPNGRGARNRDLTPPTLRQDGGEDGAEGTGEMGRGDRFLAFIKTELIPHVERTYRTTPERILAGHSRGALLVMHSLLAEPDLFAGRFLFSAPLTRDGGRLLRETEAFLRSSPALRTFVYFNWGGAENEGMARSYREMIALLEERAPAGLQWIAERAAGADHQQTQALALPAAFYEYFAARDRRGVVAPTRTGTRRPAPRDRSR